MNDRSSRPEIGTTVAGMEQYDTVFVGFPICWYREPSIIDTFMESYDFSGKTVIPFATSGGSGMGDSSIIEEGLAIDPLKDFTVFQKDVLMIHGTSDNIVNYNYAVELADAYPNAELITIEGGGHGFMGEGLTVALDATVSFVLDHISHEEQESEETAA